MFEAACPAGEADVAEFLPGCESGCAALGVLLLLLKLPKPLKPLKLLRLLKLLGPGGMLDVVFGRKIGIQHS